MKKALIISNSSGLVTDFLVNDVEILKSKGYQIDVASNLSYPGKNTDEFFKKYINKIINIDFPIRNLNLKLIYKSYKQIKKILKENNYEIIHCHSTIAAAIGRICAKKYRKKGTKVVYTSHGFPFFTGNMGKKEKLFYHIEKYLSKYTDGILTICNEDYQNALKFKCKNVFLMHGVGVDISKFVNLKVASDYKKNLGFSENDFVLLSIGELNTNKNHQIVIKAISYMKNSNIVYAICGREVVEIGQKEKLQSLANDLGVKVKFLGFRKDIPEICHCSNIGVIPSYKEGLGLSGIEMLASGLPVVGSNRQGIKDYIINGETGYLADPYDEKSFADAIVKTIKLIENEPNLPNNCIQMSKKFNSKQSYEKIKEMYNELHI